MTGQVWQAFYTFFKDNGYVVELLLAMLSFGWRVPRRPYFAARLAGVTAALLALSAGYNVLPFSSLWVSCLKNVLLVLLTIPGVCLCFDTGLVQALFVVTAAAAAQHLSFKVGQTVRSLWQAGASALLADGVYLAGFAAALGLCWLAFARRMDFTRQPQNSRSVLWLLLAVQLTTNLMQNIFLLSGDMAGSELYYIFQLYGILVCLFILGLQCEMGSRQAAQQDNRLLGQLIYQQKQQLDVRREVIGVINARCHELKQQTAALRGLVPPQQLEALNQAIDAYDTAVDTGSEPLNVLLAEKRLLCQSKQIAFDVMADGRALAFLRTSDLYALLGNLLDNAVTAAGKVSDPAMRYIRLEIARRREMVITHCENSCIPADLPDLRDGLPLPDPRKENGPHGFGLQTIRIIVERYGGSCRVSAGADTFTINLLFPGQTQLDAEK